MTLLKSSDYNSREINVALLSLEADIKNKITNFDTSVIDKQLAEINSRIDKINAGSNNTSAEINDIRYEIEDINTKIKNNSAKIKDIEQKLSDIFSAENKVTDFNTTTDSGIYYWTADAANRPTDYGVLLVNKYDDGDNNSLWVNQIAYGTYNKIYFRQNINSDNWTEWKAVAFDGEGKANFLDEYPGAGGTRLTSGNIVPKDASEYGGIRKDIVSDSMTDSGRPGQDGHLLTMFWDNAGRYDSQFFVSNDGNHPGVKVRYKSNETDYGPWVDVITSNNIGSQTVASADTVDNYHASDLWRSDGATWNPNANVLLNATANGDEWSFDIYRNGHTGCYWHVWDSTHGSLLKVNADDGKVSAPYGFVGNLTGKADTAGTADYANRLTTFASWNNPYDYDATNGVTLYVYKITMASWFNSILVQIYDDINYARCRRYVLGLWHVSNYGYNVSVTDLGGTKDGGLKVWMGTDGNVYLQADVCWTSRIAFSRLDDITDVTITKIGSARYGSNADINGNVLFTPLADPITDCGAIRADDKLSSASKVPQILKTDVLRASNIEANSKMVIPIGEPSSLEDGCIWVER